jgi:hypothetical protein
LIWRRPSADSWRIAAPSVVRQRVELLSRELDGGGPVAPNIHAMNVFAGRSVLGVTIPRPTWNPTTYADAYAEASAGHVAEHHYLELRSEYANARNEEMASDLAALANDSGVLVVGVAKDRTTGRSIGLTPFALKGFVERVEQVARTFLDPPLNVDCTTLADPAGPARGIALIRVPASALAPHQATERYFGRNERTTYRLSDAEVEALMRRRTSRVERLSALLDDPPGFDWVRGPQFGRYAAIVRPTADRAGELLAPTLALATYPVWIDKMFAAAIAAGSRLAIDAPRLAPLVRAGWSPFDSASGWSHARSNAGLRSGGPPAVVRRTARLPDESLGVVVWFGVDESGTTALALDQVVGQDPNVNAGRARFDWPTMVAAGAWLVLVTREICDSVGSATSLDVGVRADGLAGAFPLEPIDGDLLMWIQRGDGRSASTADRFLGQSHVPYGWQGPTLQAGLHAAFGSLLRGTGMGDLLRPQ